MEKATAEAILELEEAYDYATLRSAWRRLCAEYHPDRTAATGMDDKTANEVLRDINEAFNTLKPLVEGGGWVDPCETEEGRCDDGLSEEERDRLDYLYDEAMERLTYAISSSDFEKAGLKFQTLGDYRDAPRCANKCFELAIKAREEEEEEARKTSAQSQQAQEKKRKPMSGGSQLLVYLLVMAGVAVLFAWATQYFSLNSGGPSRGAQSQGAASSYGASQTVGGIPQGVKDKYLYGNASSLCSTEEGKAAVEKGRGSGWDAADEYLGRVTFGYVDVTRDSGDQHVIWMPITGSFDSYNATEEVANLAVSQMLGDADLAKRAFEDSDVWTWTEHEITMVERHEDFEVGGKTWHLKVRADYTGDDTMAFGEVTISESAFDEPLPDGKVDLELRKMSEISGA